MRTVNEIMSKDCVTVTLQDNIYEAALKMKQHDIGIIPVVEGDKLLGLVTDRDLVLRGFAEKREGSTKIEQVYSQKVKTISSQTTVDEAAKIMANEQVRRLPIVDNGKLVGIVALGDLAVVDKFENEATDALSEISESDKTLTNDVK